ncbi:universal stress protein [Rugosimonospora africana]|uniref:Universal stress protein n=1 Tax=Rugosimonospora africana TaxID=556532 RepID=A0A8J3VWS4_9ACTN|nr:universal stress protein [Rugosimonospora africana]GIH21103.1 universal stress protein [Rugosimonospora africana]
MSTYRIVAGVDGSAGGERALRWAVHEAASRGGTVQAVTAYTFDNIDPASLAGRQQHQVTVEQMLGAQVVAALANDPRVAVTTRVVFGNPTEVLLDSACDATLLVLGSHGHGRLFHAVLGSVADSCVRRATCPVVVIPVPQTEKVPAEPEPNGMPSAIL